MMIRLKKYAFTGILGFFTLTSVAQAQFEKQFSFPGQDEPRCMVLTSGGGMLIGGSTNSVGNGGLDMFVTRLDLNGNELWSRSIGTTAHDTCSSLIITTDSLIVACGNTYGGGLGNSDIYINKLDMNGQLIWTKVLGSANYDWALRAIATDDSGFVLCGYINYPPTFPPVMSSASNSFLMKVDKNGTVVWTQYYASLSCHNMVYEISEQVNGDYVLLLRAYCQSTPPYYQDEYLMMRVNSLGQILWRKNVFATPYSLALLPTADNGTFIAHSQGGGQLRTVKIDSLGTPLFSWNYGYFTDMQAWSAYEMAGGGYLIAGRVQPDQLTPAGFMFFRIGSNGYPLWTNYQRTYLGANYDQFFQSDMRPDQKIAIVSSLSDQSGDIGVIVADTNGQVFCNNDSSLTVYTNSLPLPVWTDEAQVNSPPSMLTGTSNTVILSFDFPEGSLCSAGPTAIDDEGNISSTPFVFPNPARDQIRVEWTTHQSARKEVVISTVLGQVVKRIPYTGTQQEIDVSELDRGVYVVTLEVDGVPVSVNRLTLQGL